MGEGGGEIVFPIFGINTFKLHVDGNSENDLSKCEIIFFISQSIHSQCPPKFGTL